MSAIGTEGVRTIFTKGLIPDLLAQFAEWDFDKFLAIIDKLDLTTLPEFMESTKLFAESWETGDWTGENGITAALMRMAHAGALLTKTARDDEVITFIEECLQKVGILGVIGNRAKVSKANVSDLGTPECDIITGKGFDIDKVMRWVDVVRDLALLVGGYMGLSGLEPLTAGNEGTEEPEDPASDPGDTDKTNAADDDSDKDNDGPKSE